MAKAKSKKFDVKASELYRAFKDALVYGTGYVEILDNGDVRHITYRKLKAIDYHGQKKKA